MQNDTIEIVRLEAMRVARAWDFGQNPEALAWQKLTAFAGPRGLLDAEARIYGFNNPNPAVGSPNYGYEYWIVVGQAVTPTEGVEIIDAAGGLYAVLHADVTGDYGVTIPAAWQRLDSWVAASPHRPGMHQWLEAHTHTGTPVAFYYPLAE